MAATKRPDGSSGIMARAKDVVLQSPIVRGVLLSQLLSLLLCVMGTTSGLLAARGVNMPTTQAVLNYLLLGLTCGAYHLWKRGPRLSNHVLTYLFLAVLDVEANFLVTKAYQYTSVTSVTLLDCFTIPAVMALSALALRARYLPGHYAGALLCIGGLAVLVATDGASATGGPDPVLGDALVLLGAILYACSNVAQERLLLGATPVSEMLAAVGTCGALVGGLQATLLERSAWLAADWSDPWAVAAPLAGFALALYAFSLLLPRVLVWSGATVLNLSLLTSDLWAAGSRILFFGGFGGTAGWFALSLVCEAAGLAVYTHAGQTRGTDQLLYQDVARDEEAANGGGGRRRIAGADEFALEEGEEEKETTGLLRAGGSCSAAAQSDSAAARSVTSMNVHMHDGQVVGVPYTRIGSPGGSVGGASPLAVGPEAGHTARTNGSIDGCDVARNGPDPGSPPRGIHGQRCQGEHRGEKGGSPESTRRAQLMGRPVSQGRTGPPDGGSGGRLSWEGHRGSEGGDPGGGAERGDTERV